MTDYRHLVFRFYILWCFSHFPRNIQCYIYDRFSIKNKKRPLFISFHSLYRSLVKAARKVIWWIILIPGSKPLNFVSTRSTHLTTYSIQKNATFNKLGQAIENQQSDLFCQEMLSLRSNHRRQKTFWHLPQDAKQARHHKVPPRKLISWGRWTDPIPDPMKSHGGHHTTIKLCLFKTSISAYKNGT